IEVTMNKVILMGNLTRDVEIKFLPNQTPVADFGLAVGRKYKKQDGTMAEDTCFVDCQIFGKRAEVVNQYFKKGDPIFIEGRLQFQQWEKDGQKHSRLRVFVENFEFIGKAERRDEPEPLDRNHPVFAPNDNNDDIPF
nr:single-stranded DNA-binding protein [Phycisphaerae bacterium]